MKTLRNSIAALLFVISGFTSCTKDKLTGEGSVLTESRNISKFSKIELSGFRNAEIIYADKYMVEVTGYENLVPVFKTEVSNDRLVLKYPDFTKVNNDNITLKIYTNNLTKLDVSGRSKIEIANGFSIGNFCANLSGSSEIFIGEGNCKSLQINSSGESKVYARNFKSQEADITISGRSFLEVNVISKLSANISGEGEIHYWGNPAVHSKISGNGKTVKH